MTELDIIAEDSSDIETLKVIIKKINVRRFKFKKYRARGCGRLRRKCGAITTNWVELGITYIIICHDLDCNDTAKYNKLYKEIEEKISIIHENKKVVCIVIPIQEVEAWFLADVSVLNNKFVGMNLKQIPNPENVNSPKEYIEKKSRRSNCKPRYINSIHNPEIAINLDIEKVYEKCPAFRPFYTFISNIS